MANSKKETVYCRICGCETKMTGTKLCDSCWELTKHINILINKSPRAALEFLKIKILEADMRVRKPKTKKRKAIKTRYVPGGVVT